MITNLDRLTEHGCNSEKSDKICRSRGGESCAFDGAMIVLQPIADTAHLVHGPIACCGNSWEGRGTRSSQGTLHRMGFTTDMTELDIVYGSEKKLNAAIRETAEKVKPKAVFVYATCVSGLIGEDIEAVCRQAEQELGIRVIPVSAPGFVGPKNLGNRIAGEVLLEHVIGTGTAENTTDNDINLIGEYNIAGDLSLIEPVLKKAGITILSRMTGNATFAEITWAHLAKLNVVVCSRALINIAKGMEQKYGIPYVEVSFFGKTEMSKALRAISSQLSALSPELPDRIEEVIAIEEQKLHDRLRPYEHLKGKKAVLYTGGVKSWSFISALMDLGMEIVAVGTKKSTAEDEERMMEILGSDVLLIEDVTPKNLKKLLKERNADVLVAGGRNQYLAIKEAYPFIDVNQERHVAYAGYDGLVNIAEQISNSIRFYRGNRDQGLGVGNKSIPKPQTPSPLLMNPLKHSASMGAAMALQGIHNALPIIHGAQGCTFLGKVLLTKHFREPIALAGTKLFAEDVVMGSDEALIKTVAGFVEKNSPDLIGILSSGLTEVKGDDIRATAKLLSDRHPGTAIIAVSTPDYRGGLEQGYAAAVEAVVGGITAAVHTDRTLINILAGPHLTPADATELREIVESFGLRMVLLPDMSALDGSRQGVSALAEGGTTIAEIRTMGQAAFTFAVGACLEQAAKILKDRCNIEYSVIESIAGLKDTDNFMKMLSIISGREMPGRYERQRRILVDTQRDAHAFTSGKTICIAMDEGHAVQTSRWLTETGATVGLAVIPVETAASGAIRAEKIITGGLSEIGGNFSLIMANAHAHETAPHLGIPHYEIGFPVYKTLGYAQRITIGYRGTAAMINEIATLFAKEVH